MRVISRRALREFWELHEDAEQPLRAWFKEARESEWSSPADIKARYASASILGDNRVVFNIKGNHYRLVVAVRYDLGIVFIRFVGTHEDCDRIDALAI
jgi:mRNA interferase HigB